MVKTRQMYHCVAFNMSLFFFLLIIYFFIFRFLFEKPFNYHHMDMNVERNTCLQMKLEGWVREGSTKQDLSETLEPHISKFTYLVNVVLTS